MWGKAKNGNVRTDKIDTLIASNVEITGDVHFSGGIQIDGTVVGNVVANEEKGALVRITDKGVVRGEIRGPNVIINGKVEGDVYSSEHLELAANAVVTGNVHYNLIEMVMGAEVNGSLVHETDKRALDKPETKSEKESKASSKADSGSGKNQAAKQGADLNQEAVAPTTSSA